MLLLLLLPLLPRVSVAVADVLTVGGPPAAGTGGKPDGEPPETQPWHRAPGVKPGTRVTRVVASQVLQGCTVTVWV